MTKKIVRFSKYLTFTIFIGWVGCEAYLRIFKSEHMALTHYPKIYMPDSIVGYRGIPNQKGYIKRPSIEKEFVLNNHGFFGPDFNNEHPDSIFRIMVFGSSYVEGIWGNNAESFPTTLGRLFKESGYNVEVINCGLSGASRDFMNMDLLKEFAVSCKPNLVLYESPVPVSNVYCYRDTYKGYSITYTGDNGGERQHSAWAARRKVDLLKEHKLVTDLYDLSYCVRYLARAALDTPGTMAHSCMIYANNCCDNWQYYSSFSTLTYEESMQLMNDLQLQLKQINVNLALFEYGKTRVGEVLQENPEMANFTFFSLGVPLDKKGYSLSNDVHPSVLGYNTIAENLYKKLKGQFIPERFCPRRKSMSDNMPAKMAGI